jgi:uncharacterized membrane protein YbaN (DUF454 family)
LGVSYIGTVTPGIPWSTPAVAAAFCFAKSSKRWHDYMMYHPLFGEFLRNWSTKRVFPKYGKWAMVITMDISLIVLWFTTQNVQLVLAVGVAMALCAIWALKYPSSSDEYDRRKAAGERIGWFK